jgi:hypothetical protein
MHQVDQILLQVVLIEVGSCQSVGFVLCLVVVAWQVLPHNCYCGSSLQFAAAAVAASLHVTPANPAAFSERADELLFMISS